MDLTPLGQCFGTKETRFAPGVISTDAIEYGATLSPSGDTVYFTRRASFRDNPRIFYSVASPNGWSLPKPLSLGSEEGDEYPAVSPDGRRLYFASARPHPQGASGQNSIWMSRQGPQGWGEPEPVVIAGADGVSTSHPLEGADGYLYFHGRLPGGQGRVDAYRARLAEGGTMAEAVEALPFNSSAVEGEVALSPELKWLVFYSDRLDGAGNGDLYASRAEGGSWGQPVNLTGLNTGNWEWTPSFSPDGSRLYFARLNEAYDRSDICVVEVSHLESMLAGAAQ
jgi:Tol biopolymer transport system component